jgi:hypothetical protein
MLMKISPEQRLPQSSTPFQGVKSIVVAVLYASICVCCVFSIAWNNRQSDLLSVPAGNSPPYHCVRDSIRLGKMRATTIILALAACSLALATVHATATSDPTQTDMHARRPLVV